MKAMGQLKKVIIFLIGLFLIFGSHIVYAEKMDISEIGFDGWYITLEDIYALNEEYQKNPNLEIEEAAEFLRERAAKYKEDMDYVHGTDIMGLVIRPDNDIGYMDYRTTMFLPYLSSYAGYSDVISLIAFYSDDFCRIDVSREELQEFIERNNKLLDEYSLPDRKKESFSDMFKRFIEVYKYFSRNFASFMVKSDVKSIWLYL